MSSGNSELRAGKAFDMCSERKVSIVEVADGSRSARDFFFNPPTKKLAVVTCPKYPEGLQYASEAESTTWAVRVKTARQLGCIGCEFNRDNRAEKILVDELHPEIIKSCGELFLAGHYPEAAVNGNKTVKERLRTLTGFESGSEAIGKGGLYFPTSVAEHVDGMHQQAVANTLRAIDSFRNEISHTAPEVLSAQITREVSYWHLGQSSLAMHYLDTAEARPKQ